MSNICLSCHILSHQTICSLIVQSRQSEERVKTILLAYMAKYA